VPHSHAAALLVPLLLYGFNAAIYHRSGRLVWFSPRWIVSNRASQDELLGMRYLEFLAPGESEKVLRWFGDEGTAEPLTYFYLSPSRGEWVMVTQIKRRYDGEHWLTLGERWVDVERREETGNG